jgi:hypothetical protein
MFWQWAEKHTQAYGKRFADKPSFYDAAGKKVEPKG